MALGFACGLVVGMSPVGPSAVHRWRPYRVECTGSLPTSEVKRRRARLVLGWGTAREDLRVLPALASCFAFRQRRDRCRLPKPCEASEASRSQRSEGGVAKPARLSEAWRRQGSSAKATRRLAKPGEACEACEAWRRIPAKDSSEGSRRRVFSEGF